jgi:Putative NADP-dependent oxidoreductases
MAALTNKRILLAARPEGMPKPGDFRSDEAPVRAPKDGEVLLRILYLPRSYLRGRMSAAKSYAQSVEIGHVMEGGTVAEVMESRHKDFAKGDIVLSYSGWQTHAISDGKDLRKLDPGGSPRHHGWAFSACRASRPMRGS